MVRENLFGIKGKNFIVILIRIQYDRDTCSRVIIAWVISRLNKFRQNFFHFFISSISGNSLKSFFELF